MGNLYCRVCGAPLHRTFVDLGSAPPCEAILTAAAAEDGELAYPLHVRICEECLLVQLPEVLPAEEIFTDEYAYFSSYSSSWVEHAGRYARDMIDRLSLGAHSVSYTHLDVYKRQIRTLATSPAAPPLPTGLSVPPPRRV